MKRALLAALLAGLALAAPAGADVPPVHGGSAIGRDLPLKVYASLNPPVHLFGDAITARVAVVADRKWVAPANVRVGVDFAPYRPIGPPSKALTASGRLLQITWTWTLRCLSAQCVPETKTSEIARVFHFAPVRVRYVSPTGATRYSLVAHFQSIVAQSQLSPKVVNALQGHQIDWQDPITPVAAPRYGVSPGLAFWLAVALAAVLGTAGLALAARWALQMRPRTSKQATLPASSLERALTLFFWARANDDDTLQRKALERVADELPFDVRDLSATAHALAWSPEVPDEKDVQEISDRAGIHHRRNGEPQA